MFERRFAPLVDRLNPFEEIEELVQHPPLLRQQLFQLLANHLQLGALGLDAVEGEVVILEKLLPDLAQLAGLGAVHSKTLSNGINLDKKKRDIFEKLLKIISSFTLKLLIISF
jgi:hypothetical protein